MKISKYIAAVLSCLFLVLAVMSGCFSSTLSPTTSSTVLPTEPIPTEPDGSRIGKNAYNGSDITGFTVDDIVKWIDEGAFANCTALENLYCTSRDISIHENAFSGTENVVFHCYLSSTVDMFAREHGYDRVYFDTFSICCDTVKNGCVGLPITWSAVDVMPGQTVSSQFVYTVNLNGEPIFTSEPTEEDRFVYTPTEGGQYTLTVKLMNDLTTASLTSEAVSVADELIMGLFEQDNDDTAVEPIQWRILAVEDGKALVISEHILTKDSYFNPEWIKYKYTYWANSCIAESSPTNYWGSAPADPSRLFGNLTPESVPMGWYAERGPEKDLFYLHARYWCNEVFYKEHFSAEERERILLSNLTNPDNPTYGTVGGPDTQDYIFFLSYEEVNTYMPTREERMATVTDYAFNRPIAYGENAPYYWLRSPGKYQTNGMYIWGDSGYLDYYGSDVGHNILGYRPAMWITVGG